jgi:hypothetical protein
VQVKIGMDVAASEFYTEDKMYDLDFKNANNDGSQKKTSAQMQDLYKSFTENFPVISIEDPFDQVRTCVALTEPPSRLQRLASRGVRLASSVVRLAFSLELMHVADVG